MSHRHVPPSISSPTSSSAAASSSPSTSRSPPPSASPAPPPTVTTPSSRSRSPPPDRPSSPHTASPSHKAKKDRWSWLPRFLRSSPKKERSPSPSSQLLRGSSSADAIRLPPAVAGAHSTPSTKSLGLTEILSPQVGSSPVAAQRRLSKYPCNEHVELLLSTLSTHPPPVALEALMDAATAAIGRPMTASDLSDDRGPQALERLVREALGTLDCITGVVSQYELGQVNSVWASVEALFHFCESASDRRSRHFVLHFACACMEGQYDRLNVLRFKIFAVIQKLCYSPDASGTTLALSLRALSILTKSARKTVPFANEVAELLCLFAAMPFGVLQSKVRASAVFGPSYEGDLSKGVSCADFLCKYFISFMAHNALLVDEDMLVKLLGTLFSKVHSYCTDPTPSSSAAAPAADAQHAAPSHPMLNSPPIASSPLDSSAPDDASRLSAPLVVKSADLQFLLRLCLPALDAVACHGIIPQPSLREFVHVVCLLMNVSTHLSWQVMRHLLSRRDGRTAMSVLLHLMDDSAHLSPDALRGAVFFTGMSMWGSQRISAMDMPFCTVIPHLHAAIACNQRPVVSEVLLSLRRLVKKYGHKLTVEWDAILDTLGDCASFATPAPQSPAHRSTSTLSASSTGADGQQEIPNKQFSRRALRAVLCDTWEIILDLNAQDKLFALPNQVLAALSKCSECLGNGPLLHRLFDLTLAAVHPSQPGWLDGLVRFARQHFVCEPDVVIQLEVVVRLERFFQQYRVLYGVDFASRVLLPTMVAARTTGMLRRHETTQRRAAMADAELAADSHSDSDDGSSTTPSGNMSRISSLRLNTRGRKKRTRRSTLVSRVSWSESNEVNQRIAQLLGQVMSEVSLPAELFAKMLQELKAPIDRVSTQQMPPSQKKRRKPRAQPAQLPNEPASPSPSTLTKQLRRNRKRAVDYDDVEIGSASSSDSSVVGDRLYMSPDHSDSRSDLDSDSAMVARDHYRHTVRGRAMPGQPRLPKPWVPADVDPMSSGTSDFSDSDHVEDSSHAGHQRSWQEWKRLALTCLGVLDSVLDASLVRPPRNNSLATLHLIIELVHHAEDFVCAHTLQTLRCIRMTPSGCVRVLRPGGRVIDSLYLRFEMAQSESPDLLPAFTPARRTVSTNSDGGSSLTVQHLFDALFAQLSRSPPRPPQLLHALLEVWLELLGHSFFLQGADLSQLCIWLCHRLKNRQAHVTAETPLAYELLTVLFGFRESLEYLRRKEMMDSVVHGLALCCEMLRRGFDVSHAAPVVPLSVQLQHQVFTCCLEGVVAGLLEMPEHVATCLTPILQRLHATSEIARGRELWDLYVMPVLELLIALASHNVESVEASSMLAGPSSAQPFSLEYTDEHVHAVINILVPLMEPTAPPAVVQLAHRTVRQWFFRMTVEQRARHGLQLAEALDSMVQHSADNAPMAEITLDILCRYTHSDCVLDPLLAANTPEMRVFQDCPSQTWAQGTTLITITSGRLGYARVHVRRISGSVCWHLQLQNRLFDLTLHPTLRLPLAAIAAADVPVQRHRRRRSLQSRHQFHRFAKHNLRRRHSGTSLLPDPDANASESHSHDQWRRRRSWDIGRAGETTSSASGLTPAPPSQSRVGHNRWTSIDSPQDFAVSASRSPSQSPPIMPAAARGIQPVSSPHTQSSDMDDPSSRPWQSLQQSEPVPVPSLIPGGQPGVSAPQPTGSRGIAIRGDPRAQSHAQIQQQQQQHHQMLIEQMQRRAVEERRPVAGLEFELGTSPQSVSRAGAAALLTEDFRYEDLALSSSASSHPTPTPHQRSNSTRSQSSDHQGDRRAGSGVSSPTLQLQSAAETDDAGSSSAAPRPSGSRSTMSMQFSMSMSDQSLTQASDTTSASAQPTSPKTRAEEMQEEGAAGSLHVLRAEMEAKRSQKQQEQQEGGQQQQEQKPTAQQQRRKSSKRKRKKKKKKKKKRSKSKSTTNTQEAAAAMSTTPQREQPEQPEQEHLEEGQASTTSTTHVEEGSELATPSYASPSSAPPSGVLGPMSPFVLPQSTETEGRPMSLVESQFPPLEPLDLNKSSSSSPSTDDDLSAEDDARSIARDDSMQHVFALSPCNRRRPSLTGTYVPSARMEVADDYVPDADSLGYFGRSTRSSRPAVSPLRLGAARDSVQSPLMLSPRGSSERRRRNAESGSTAPSSSGEGLRAVLRADGLLDGDEDTGSLETDTATDEAARIENARRVQEQRQQFAASNKRASGDSSSVSVHAAGRDMAAPASDKPKSRGDRHPRVGDSSTSSSRPSASAQHNKRHRHPHSRNKRRQPSRSPPSEPHARSATMLPEPSAAAVQHSSDRTAELLQPSFVLLQVYDALALRRNGTALRALSDSKPAGDPSSATKAPRAGALERSLKQLDSVPSRDTCKVGILFIARGQDHEAETIFGNESGSRRYDAFLQRMGHMVPLEPRTSVYTGGLDTSGHRDGRYALVWSDECVQMCFHVATMIPNRVDKYPAFENKVRHVCNNFVNVIFNESGRTYEMSTLRGQFNFVNIVVTPMASKRMQVQVLLKPSTGLRHFGPAPLHRPGALRVFSDEAAVSYVRRMALSARYACLEWQAQRKALRFAPSNWQERREQLRRIQDRLAVAPSFSNGEPSAHDLASFLTERDLTL